MLELILSILIAALAYVGIGCCLAVGMGLGSQLMDQIKKFLIQKGWVHAPPETT